MRAKKREFKKKVVLSTGSIFVCTCIVALIFSWNEKPTEVFTYIIPTAGGVFGAAVIWYLKAVQLENGIKKAYRHGRRKPGGRNQRKNHTKDER